jgi:RNA polymerase sigma-70 factor, ECF subfamily
VGRRNSVARALLSAPREVVAPGPTLPPEIRHHLGWCLRENYAARTARTPKRLRLLLDSLEQVLLARGATLPASFVNDVLAAIPSLRAFAISLTGNLEQSDDLVQNTILRAFEKSSLFKPGTNLTAWLFTILKHSFFNEHRKRSREVPD